MRISAGLVLGNIGLVLPLLSASPVLEAFAITTQTFFNQNLWLTISTLWAVIVLETEIRTLNIGERMATKLSLSGTRTSLALIPALLGLLPAAAGARFSVGIVQTLARNTNASPDNLAAVNFWFRHVNIFCNPLITGTVLASAISGLPAHRLLTYGIPITLLTSVIGWFFFIRPIQSCPVQSRTFPKRTLVKNSRLETHFVVLIPLSLAAALFLPGQLLCTVMPAIIVGAIATMTRTDFRHCINLFIPKANDRRILFEVVAILWFVAAAQTSGLTHSLVDMVLSCSLPAAYTLFLCAFIITGISGLCLPSVAFVMPIAAELFPADTLTAYAMLLAGFAAQFITPAHLCLIVSADTFGSGTGILLRRMFPALMLSLIGTILVMSMFEWLNF